MRVRIGVVGGVGLAGLTVGLLLLFLTSGTASAVGLVVALVAVAFMVADQLPSGVLGGYGAGVRSPGKTRPDPPPEYVEKTASASDDAWRREQAHYREKTDA